MPYILQVREAFLNMKIKVYHVYMHDIEGDFCIPC